MLVSKLPQLQTLPVQQSRLLFEEASENRNVQVRQYRKWRWLHFNTIAIQSVMNITESYQLVQTYNIAMLVALLFDRHPARVMSLGLAGASFERFFMHFYPNTQLTSIEYDPTVISLAHEYFNLPLSYAVTNQRAEDYIKQTGNCFDLILYDIDDTVTLNSHSIKPDFYQNISRCLEDHGVFVMNLLADCESEVLAVLKAMRVYFPWTVMLDLPAHKNIILYALKYPPQQIAELIGKIHSVPAVLQPDLNVIVPRLVYLPCKSVSR